MKFLDGDRIYLKHIDESDYQIIYRVVQDPEIRRLTGTQSFLTYEKIAEAYEGFKKQNNRIDLMIVLKENDEVIGDLALLDVDSRNRNGSVRIAIHEEKFRSNGYGTEALDIILKYAFDQMNLHRISLNVYSFNKRAKKSYEKLGFEQEGILREELFYDGIYHDNILMGLLKEEYKRKK
ncbi:GNAT family N-acetyltransferase [Falsibacillus pallidus]|uniref:RimJ/RimL family protein N-acetyltransferase n=1 Tax=Falsibacillus pallidus TaxID=493781 RepID=A0A370GHS9_9BACI|nr:GNAT family protein [Falsibacillus pallidus]RDI43211.1 RimJ/RimL family protein N-acetyltransferase [Falsibacillus pallidus]